MPAAAAAARRSSYRHRRSEGEDKDVDEVTWVRRAVFRSEAEARQYLASRSSLCRAQASDAAPVSTTVVRVSVRSVDVPPPSSSSSSDGGSKSSGFRELQALRFVSR